MRIRVEVGDVLNTPADVLIAPANPWLNLSGGVNAAISQRCPEIQTELHGFLKSQELAAVPAGTVVRTTGGNLPFAHILHAVAIDPFYDSSEQLVQDVLAEAFKQAASLAARRVALPALATGYGPLTLPAFANALKPLLKHLSFACVTIIVRKVESQDAVRSVLSGSTG